MTTSLAQVLLFLIAGIGVIVLLTARYRVHAFFALIIACFVVGLGVQMPVAEILRAARQGFGNIMQSLGLIIVLGTTLGVLLEHSGSTRVMADFILKKVGDRNAALAMSITGFVVGLPIFCDSGFIVLNGLNQSLARKTGISIIIMSISLATGLYSVHCLVPPHPGAAAAAGTIGVDFGKLILTGIIVAIPAMLTGYWWARYAARKIPTVAPQPDHHIPASKSSASVASAFLPVIVPILLIALKSFISIEHIATEDLINILNIAGDPVIALAIGVLLAFATGGGWSRGSVGKLLQESAEKAGSILVIIGAGGAFGSVLEATHLGNQFSNLKGLSMLGIFFPFLISSVLKTAQGSSTVAIITAASIVLPLLPALGLNTEQGKILTVLSMGAGSMMISHANDAYFWVIAKFSGLEMKTMLKVYSMATLFMGVVSLAMIYVLSFLMQWLTQ